MCSKIKKVIGNRIDQFGFFGEIQTILWYCVGKCRFSFSCISPFHPWMHRLKMTIASMPLIVSISGTSRRFRKTTSYAIPLFFFLFSYSKACMCAYSSLESRGLGLLSGHVRGKETLSYVAKVQIRHDLCSVSMHVKRVVSRKPSRSRIQFAFHWIASVITQHFLKL